MKRILCFLNKYSNALTAISACLTAVATFLILGVVHKQTEIMFIIGKAAERPIIEIDYISEPLHFFLVRNNLGDMAGKNMEIRTIRVRNIGRGTAFNLKMEHRGRDHIEEEDMLLPGGKYEYFISREDIKSGGVSPFAKVTYQDVFENEFISDLFGD